MLPQLVESLSSRVVSEENKNEASENDWDAYLEILIFQDKRGEALEALGEIECSPMVGKGANWSDRRNWRRSSKGSTKRRGIIVSC